MPADREIHFGFPTAAKAWAWADRIGLPMSDEGGAAIALQEWLANSDDSDLYLDVDTSRFDGPLRAAFMDTIQDMGWQTGRITGGGRGSRDDHYVGVITPWGNREAGVWGLYTHYDPVELGDRPEDLSIGVNLSSRYFPAILDMESEHGSFGTIVLDQAFMDRIAVCKRNLIKHIPELDGAEIYIREIFY